MKNYPNIFIAGQLSGVEGYIESISSGLMCGINMANYLEGKELIHFGTKTMIGALSSHIANASNFGIVDSLTERIKSKKEKNTKLAEISLKTIDDLLNKK